jgi:glycosyltransferase involved in cell wall biosynthesis
VLITGSQVVKMDLERTYRLKPDQVLVSPQGIDPVFRPTADAQAARARFGLDGRYVVALGGSVRRNLPMAIEAWRRAMGPDVPLVVVGPEPPDAAPGIVHAGRVDDDTWAGLLAGSSAFIYPTAYEGFGMPGLEALACGAPVIAARVGSLPEVLGDAAAWTERLDADAIAAKLSQVVADAALASDLRSRALARAAAAPGWEQAAAVHLQAYRRAAA